MVFIVFIKILLHTEIWTTLENLEKDDNGYMVIKLERMLKNAYEEVHIVSLHVWNS